jgi:multicomponent Na+:H+ antiporter subunit B
VIKYAVFAACTIVTAIVVGAALLGLPAFGHYQGPYGDAVVAPSLVARHTSNVVGAVAYDIRGFDTLGEETILFAAVIGVSLLVRLRGETHREEHGIDRAGAASRNRDEKQPALMLTSACLLALGIVFGLYFVLHATQTPGGGFQGGAIVASAIPLVYLGFGYRAWTRSMRERWLDIAEAGGVLVFVVIAAVPIAMGAHVVANWLPLGSLGKFASGGTQFVINIGIGLAVAAGFVAILGSLLFDFHEAIEGVAQDQKGEPKT